MDDWLDEALYRLPAGEVPPDLVGGVLLALRRRRRLQRAARAGPQLAAVLALGAGLALAAGAVPALQPALPVWSWESTLAFLGRAFSSPSAAILGGVNSLAGWIDSLHPRLEWTLLLGLILLSLPALGALRSLLEGNGWERSEL